MRRAFHRFWKSCIYHTYYTKSLNISTYSVDSQWCLGWSIPFYHFIGFIPFYCPKKVWINKNDKKGWIDQDVIDGPHCISTETNLKKVIYTLLSDSYSNLSISMGDICKCKQVFLIFRHSFFHKFYICRTYFGNQVKRRPKLKPKYQETLINCVVSTNECILCVWYVDSDFRGMHLLLHNISTETGVE